MSARDFRLAVRLLLKSPAYAIATALTLAVAIGANAAVFSAVYAVLLKPVPIHEPERIVVGWETDTARGLPVVELPYRLIESIARDVRGLSSVAAMSSSVWPGSLRGRDATQRVAVAGVSASFFETLGAPPAMGRTFRPEDDVPNAAPVVILSYGAWRTRFGGDPGIIGSRIDVDGPRTVVGVMPAGFDVPRDTEFWMPVVPILADAVKGALENVGVLYLVGRLAPGVTPIAAREQLDRFMAGRARTGVQDFTLPLVLTPFIEYAVGPARQALWALLAAVVILLLIGCANVSGLMLTRVSLRRREHGIRLALGATPAAIARLWIIETALLSIVGGVLGFGASHAIAKALVALAPEGIPRLGEVTINVPVALFAFAAVSATALMCGIGPVRQAVAADLVHDLADEARSTITLHTRRVRSALVVLQIALSIVLLVAAALVLRSFLNLRALNLGFAPSGVLTMNVAPENPKPSSSVWFDELLRRIDALPNVEAAGAVSLRPLALGVIGQETFVRLEGQPDTPAAFKQNPSLNYEVVTPAYFQAMRIALERGRLFDARDDGRSMQVAIVSKSTARRLWPGQDPIGRRVLIPSMKPAALEQERRTVVGLVDDVRYRGLDDVRLDIYVPALQAFVEARTLVIRTSQDPVGIAAAVQAEARRLDPNAVIDGVTTMEAVVARVMAPWRFSAWTFAVFATFAFALAIVGLFSLVLLEVTHRRHELAIRLALGARRADLLRSVLVPAAWRGLAGTIVGLFAALIGSRALERLVFGIATIDGATYAIVIMLVIGVVTIASYVPARNAAAVDPAELFSRR